MLEQISNTLTFHENSFEIIHLVRWQNFPKNQHLVPLRRTRTCVYQGVRSVFVFEQKLHFCFRTLSLSMEFIMNSKRELELITSPISGCQICLVVFLESDALNLNEVFDLFQKLRLVIHASYCMTSLFCFQIPRKSVI